VELYCGPPPRGRALEGLRSFLAAAGIGFDEGVTYTVSLVEGDEICASGSLDGSVLKCIAVSADRGGEGLAAVILTELINEAGRRGHHHLFIFTKPGNEELFRSLGFFPVAGTAGSLLMENKKGGAANFAASLERPPPSRREGIGAILMNCNPFTLGHRYLAEKAAAECGALHLFVVSEDRSAFPAEVRLRLARAGTAHLENVLVHPTGPYLISAATFPDYFIKDKVRAEKINTLLDLTIFAECFARPLEITRRFVGEEPLDPVTGAYNRQMKEFLPLRGIEVREIKRFERGGGPVSASRVRKLLAEGRLEEAAELVPPTTMEYLRNRDEQKPV
jgi:[citrate (pro-3S)-lyase] ligase